MQKISYRKIVTSISLTSLILVLINIVLIDRENQITLNSAKNFILNDPIFFHPKNISEKIYKLFCDKNVRTSCMIQIYQEHTLIVNTPDSSNVSIPVIKNNVIFNNFHPPLQIVAYSLPSLPHFLIKFLFILFVFIFFIFIYFFKQKRKNLQILDLELKNKDLENSKLKLEAENTEIMANIAKQVTHDIRSPLAALNIVVKQLGNVPEDIRILIRGSVERINDIANNLLQENSIKPIDQKQNLELIGPIIDSLISEKRMQYRDKYGVLIECDLTQSYGLFVLINSIEFRRTLSNLINNAVEASDSTCKVDIKVYENTLGNILIDIIDNGRGIPAEILHRLGEKGFSWGKSDQTDSGAGLGIYHAKTTIENAGGNLTIKSKLHVGTTITISLPKQIQPSWFVEKIVINPDTMIVILDDDHSIHNIWNDRFKNLDVTINNFASAVDFIEYIKLIKNKETLFFIDFELLNQKFTGIDIIENLNIMKNSILVTSHYEEKDLQERCEKNNIRLLPKGMAGFIPVQIEQKIDNQFADYVYLEDDKYLRASWQLMAKSSNINLLTISSTKEFEKYAYKISKEKTKIYIDCFLGKDEIKGDEFAVKLHHEGYKHLFLATGYESANFSHLPWLKHTNKDCPFEFTT